jgi:hypothetical protein
MVARYLQEQSSGADLGSLLMGFLDFYGNHVRIFLATLPLFGIRDFSNTDTHLRIRYFFYVSSSTLDLRVLVCENDSTLLAQITIL